MMLGITSGSPFVKFPLFGKDSCRTGKMLADRRDFRPQDIFLIYSIYLILRKIKYFNGVGTLLEYIICNKLLNDRKLESEGGFKKTGRSMKILKIF